MTLHIFFRATLVWFVIAGLAIGNGLFRNAVLMPAFGQEIALPLSGITLSIIVLVITFLAHPFLQTGNTISRWLVGLQWVAMTLIFEFAFGHYVAGESWTALAQTLNPFRGDLLLPVLLVTLSAPALAARYRERIEHAAHA